MADVGNVQAIVARSSAKPLSVVLMFKLGDAGGAKAFLREWLPKTPAGMAMEVDGQPAFHFLFSWTGIEKVLSGHADLDVTKGRKEFEVFFVDPVQAPDAAVAEQLGFLGTSAPTEWWDRKFASRDVDLALYISFETPRRRRISLDRCDGRPPDTACRNLCLTERTAHCPDFRPSDGRLHFGYRDGITSPKVDWDDTKAPGTVNCREFVVGYPNEDYPTSPRKPGVWRDFAQDGSYVGLSWVYQDVAAFNKFLKDNASEAAGEVGAELAEEWIAAKLMGRWRHGSPLSNHPSAPPSAPDLNDAFGYANDPRGEKCPITSHIPHRELPGPAI